MPHSLLFVYQLPAFGVISHVLIFAAVRTSDLTTLITFVERLLKRDNSVYFPARLILLLQQTMQYVLTFIHRAFQISEWIC